MQNVNILVIEDEQRLAEVIRKHLEDSGYMVDVAHDGYIGKQMSEAKRYSLILLDINLPIINGFDLCREIRLMNKEIPIIMLTAYGTPDHKLTGFDAGADDYIVKPFDYRELLARVNVFLRRSEQVTKSETLSLANLEVDLNMKSVQRDGKKIDLTVKEYALLETFMQNQGKLLTREFIIEKVWGIDFDPGTNIIDVYVNYLRKKIDKDFEPKLIHTRFGFGFYFSDREI